MGDNDYRAEMEHMEYYHDTKLEIAVEEATQKERDRILKIIDERLSELLMLNSSVSEMKQMALKDIRGRILEL